MLVLVFSLTGFLLDYVTIENHLERFKSDLLTYQHLNERQLNLNYLVAFTIEHISQEEGKEET